VILPLEPTPHGQMVVKGSPVKRRGRSCRRWQLFGLRLDLRGSPHLGMHHRFRNPRRSHVTPCREYRKSPSSGRVGWVSPSTTPPII